MPNITSKDIASGVWGPEAARVLRESMRRDKAVAAQLPPTWGKMRRRSKYGAQATTIDGHRFPSKKEATFYSDLCLQLKARSILGFCIQPRFLLPGPVWYVADFIVWDTSGEVRVIDVKGLRTPQYKDKRKQVRAIHHIEIEEV